MKSWFGQLIKGRSLLFITIALLLAYAGTIYSRDSVKRYEARKALAQRLYPELGQSPAPQEGTSNHPYLPELRSINPKRPVGRPPDLPTAAQYLQGDRTDSRTQGTLYFHQQGREQPEEVIPILRSLLQAKRGEVRAAALIALGWIKNPSVIPDVIYLAGDTQSWVRETVAESLGLLGGGEQVVSSLGSLARDADPSVRSVAAQSLGLNEDPRGIGILNSLLNDSDETVRVQAARALRDIWTPRTPLDAKKEPKPPSVDPALKELSFQALLDHLKTDSSPEVRRYAAEALGGVGDPSALSVLQEKLLDEKEDEFVHYSAALAIGRLGAGSKEAELALRKAQSTSTSAILNRGLFQALRRLKLTPLPKPK